MNGLSDVSHRALLAGSRRVLANRRTLTLAIGSALLVAFGHAIGAEDPLPPWCPPYPTPEDPIECQPTNPPPPLPNVVRYTDNQFVPTSSGARIPYDANKNVTLPDNDPVVLDGRAVALASATGTGSRISNLADGVDGMDAVNRRQLDGVQSIATNAQNTANTAINTANTAINTANTARTEVSNLDALAVKYTSTAKTQVTLGGAKLSNIADGTAATDAVNRRQLDSVSATATNAQTTANNAYTTVNQLAGNALQFDGLTFNALRSGAPTRISGIADGEAETDAVNRRQLDTVRAEVQQLDGMAVKYTDLTRTTVMLGAQGTPVRVTNVADGVAETDAVNRRQLDAVRNDISQATSDALKFDGQSYNALRGGAATRISGVADGEAETDAVNRRQLDTVRAEVQQLDGMAVKYTDLTRTTVMLGAQGTPVRVTNVADGVAETDAVNRRQLDAVRNDISQATSDALKFDGQSYNALRGGAATRISGVAAGVAGDHAVNFDQLSAVSAVFGGGARWSAGSFLAPTYTINGRSYSTVGDAFAAVDLQITNLNERVSTIETTPRDPNPGSGSRSVDYDTDARDSVTLRGGANGTRVSNVAAGVEATDAANVAQVRQAEANSRTYTDTRTAETLRESRQYTDTRTAETLRESKQYTDTRFQEVLRGFDDFTAQVDRRLQQTDKRISRQSAMTSAMVQMGINAAGARTERGRVAVGMGVSDDGEAALSVGYSKTFGNRVSVSIGGAFSGGEASGGVGIGFDL